ncbi:MAG: hypothetical protein ABI237_06280 [Ginsengibacter sp.]
MVICFSYRNAKNDEEMAVKDANGKYISLKGQYGEFLNFFHFNGWKLKEILHPGYQNGGSYSDQGSNSYMYGSQTFLQKITK